MFATGSYADSGANNAQQAQQEHETRIHECGDSCLGIDYDVIVKPIQPAPTKDQKNLTLFLSQFKVSEDQQNCLVFLNQTACKIIGLPNGLNAKQRDCIVGGGTTSECKVVASDQVKKEEAKNLRKKAQK